MARGRVFFAVAMLLLSGLLSGCGRAASVRLADVVPMTVDALTVLLVGDSEAETATRPTPSERPLLESGVFEHVLVAADGASFAHVSRGRITADEVRAMQYRVVDELRRNVQKRGRFTVEASPFPPTGTPEKTLFATLTPHTEETGSPQDKARGKMRTMVLIRLTISNAKTGEVLRLRDYYSGADAKNPGEPFRR